ncbi:MAG: zinc ABC transporter permease [SAR86 cluster bacterium]|uniref:Zinc ABC transporter permease n=1 Tax=SAR86 cluster bacterium TaxID=2030880 RepID=A0A2A5BCJ0_9GAMM|nr:MAG: zinc ABC transporter permease [SAR86 cluster bacterium]
MNSFYEWVRTSLQGLAQEGVLPVAFEYGFVINALLCALLIGPLLGGIGTMVVAKRMAFFSQSIGNAAMTGVAIGILLGESYTEPYISMFSFCILFALLLNYTKSRTQLSSDTLIGVFLSVSLAIGASLLLFVSARVNTHILEAVLFGSVLTVSDTDMNVLLVVAIIVLGTGVPLFNRMLLASLNPSLARARKIPVELMEYVFVLMITLLTVACLKIVGAVLVEALLLIPAAAARNISSSLRGFVFYSMIFSTISCIAGVLIPMQWNLPLPSGGAIIMVAACLFLITTIIRATVPAFREARA